MPQVKERILKYGKRKYKTENIKTILKKMKKEGFSDRELSEKFKCTVPAIRHWLKKLGLLKPRPRFPEWLQQEGYKSLAAFFRHPKNVEKTFKELSKETGYCYPTISHWYHVFEQESEFKRS